MGVSGVLGIPPPVARFDLEDDASRMVAEAISAVVSDPHDCVMNSRVVEGKAARVLIDAAAGAGHARGRQSGPRRLHAGASRFGRPALRPSRNCPVVIIPGNG